ncbi:winged helix-turn-helix domain-containing protein [Arsukibacterium sp.]|uniref:winged helix-turn-helix domain-containing protein n=1 Tax=Arsukibacterium sp. TaxID=1977258 RepID=UPI001BD5B316|nr:winged helix-turn-helix domain-containing protein [Arsukibacterium sp.]
MNDSEFFSAGHEPVVSDLQQKNALHAGFYLGDIQVLPDDGCIVVAGERRHISANAMELLLVLAAHAQQLVSQAVLLEAITGSAQSNKDILSHLVSELRQAMGDHKACPIYIQTLIRRGYRLIQPVSKQAQLISEPAIQQAVAAGARWSWWYALVKGSRLFRVTIACLVSVWLFIQVMAITFPLLHITTRGMKMTLLTIVVLFPLILFYTWLKDLKTQRARLTASAHPRAQQFWRYQLKIDIGFLLLSFVVVSLLGLSLKRALELEAMPLSAADAVIAVPALENAVAVMPFRPDNASQDNVDAYLIEGLRDELLYSLTQLNAFPVISARAMQGLPEDADHKLISERLGALYVVEGKLKATDQDLQLEVVVIQLESGVRQWSGRMAATRQQLPQLQQELYRQLASAFGLLMQNKQLDATDYSLTTNFQAYDAYLRANKLLKQFADMKSLENAERLFLQALEHDPKFALASAGLCKLHLEKYAMNRSLAEFELARQACEHAASFPVNQAPVYSVLGDLYRTRGEFALAMTQYDLALQLNPALPDAITGKAISLADLNLPVEAGQLFTRAIRLEPGYWQHYSNYGRFLYNSGQFSEASRQFERAALIQPDSVDIQNSLGASYFFNNNFAAAIAAWQKVVANSPLALAYSNLGTAYYFNGEFSQAEQMYLAALQTSQNDYTILANLADSLDAQPGREPEAQTYYRQALQQAQANLSVNQDAKALRSQIIRIQSELALCEQAQQDLEQLSSNPIDDFYIYYDLAIASFNCDKPVAGAELVAKALAGGYSAALVAADPKIPANKQYH